MASGIEAAKATEYARFADARRSQTGRPFQLYDLTASVSHDAPFTLDYIADIGDGFNATFATAMALAGKAHGDAKGMAPADLLVVGGDAVYPVASVRNYRDRMKRPFRDASSTPGEPAAGVRANKGLVAALPGNHDWYDGLVGFMRIFGENYIESVDANGIRRTAQVETVTPSSPRNYDTALQRHTFQSRSYFAARLPHGWWIWGLDIQLDSFIDEEQLAYFAYAKANLLDNERVILCTARPSWIDAPNQDKGYQTSNRETLIWFLDRFFGDDNRQARAREAAAQVGIAMVAPSYAQVPLLISGDKHHFVHHELIGADARSTEPQHLITCGGGGAYLSSTHKSKKHLDLPWHQGEPAVRYERRGTYPSALRSRWWISGTHLLRIPFVNGIATPFLLAVIGLSMSMSLYEAHRTHGDSWHAHFLFWPLLVIVAVVAAAAATLAAAFRPKSKRGGMWPFVAIFHVALFAGGAALMTWVINNTFDRSSLPRDPAHRTLLDLTLGQSVWLVALSAVLSVLSFTLYLLVSDVVGFHENEFFAAMRIPGYKSYLRLSFGPSTAGGSGTLLVTPFGCRRPPWNRRRSFDGTGRRPTPPVWVALGTIRVEGIPSVSRAKSDSEESQ